MPVCGKVSISLTLSFSSSSRIGGSSAKVSGAGDGAAEEADASCFACREGGDECDDDDDCFDFEVGFFFVGEVDGAAARALEPPAFWLRCDPFGVLSGRNSSPELDPSLAVAASSLRRVQADAGVAHGEEEPRQARRGGLDPGLPQALARRRVTVAVRAAAPAAAAVGAAAA